VDIRNLPHQERRAPTTTERMKEEEKKMEVDDALVVGSLPIENKLALGGKGNEAG